MESRNRIIQVGILSSAHLHCASYVSCIQSRSDSEIVGLWDDNEKRGVEFAQERNIRYFRDLDELLSLVDAVAITSENHHHLPLVEAASKQGKHILCEKPVVARETDIERFEKAVANSGAIFMTAFPCRFSPAFQLLKTRISSGEIGNVVSISATNRGRCPFGWFVQTELSGGGAMIDHVVHVTDLLRDLLAEEVESVQAQIGSNVYSETWEDTAMLTMMFPSGVFATLDSSWSRPAHYKTWGDVTMSVVGEKGVIELDMFGSAIDHYSSEPANYSALGYGSDLDEAMVDAFLTAIQFNATPPVTLRDGIQAAKVALAGYRSVECGQPVGV